MSEPRKHHIDGITWWLDADGNLWVHGGPTLGTLTADLGTAFRPTREEWPIPEEWFA